MKITITALGALAFFALASPALAAFTRDGAVIQNSGSTNATGYTLKVWSDGNASAVASNRLGSVAGSPRRATVGPALAQRFMRDLKIARDARATGETCMKSASFGYRINVMWHGWTSPDLSCPGADARTVALANDVRAIEAATGTAIVTPHRGLLPNEPRMLRPESSPSPQPTPE
jgi:hypothetical protein